MSVYNQVLKDMAGLLNAVSGELTNEKVKNQAHLVQEKVHVLLSQMTNPATHVTDDGKLIAKKVENMKETSVINANSPQSGKSSPFVEVEGKPIAGIPLSYVNSLEQKRGHRCRQSMLFNQTALLGDEDVSDGE